MKNHSIITKSLSTTAIRTDEVKAPEMLLGYFIGPFGAMLSSGIFTSFLQAYLGDVLGLDAGFLSVLQLVSTVLIVAANLVVGQLIERTKSMAGKARPWILLSALTLSIASVLMFVVPFQGTARYIWIAIAYNLYYAVAYQAILNKESHVGDIAFLTTLAGYIHYVLTGEKVMGIGDASGMFPIDSGKLDYDQVMVEKFDAISGMNWKLRDILPKVLVAGDNGGTLTESGAKFLDPSGTLKAGIPVAPCEGDAGTGMSATNSVRERTGNVSAGTSDFAMLVTDHALGVHREIDMVTTPAGAPVAMVHCNNCTSDINAWVALLSEFAEFIGAPQQKGKLFTMLFRKALEGDADCGGLLSYNYFSGEGVTDMDEGRPVFVRTPNASFNLANFMRTHILSALATLKIGLDILTKEENVEVDKLYGHGGFFKTPEVGQRMLSAAIGAPVSCMESAGEGGPYGMALLAAYMIRKTDRESLADYLDNKVFAGAVSTTLMADQADIDGFNSFLARYKSAFGTEKAAVEGL